MLTCRLRREIRSRMPARRGKWGLNHHLLPHLSQAFVPFVLALYLNFPQSDDLLIPFLKTDKQVVLFSPF